MDSFDANGATKRRQGRPHVLVVPIAAAGHLPPLEQLVYKLDAERPGVIVTIVAPPKCTKELTDRRSKGDFQNIDLRLEEIPGIIPRYEKDPIFSTRAGLVAEQNYKETEPLREKIRQQKASGGEVPTAIISDYFYFWCKNFADEIGIPWYTYFLCSPLWTLMILEHPKVLEARVDLEAAIANGTDKQLLLEAVPKHVPSPSLSPICIRDIPDECFKFAEFFTKLSETSLKAAGVLINVAEEVDASGGSVSAIKTLVDPSKVFCIGPSFQMPGFGLVQAIEPDDQVFPWLSSQKKNSVLYVAFGSVCALSKNLILELAEGLEASDVPFLWALKPGGDKLSALLPKGFEERTAGRGVIATGWVSQTAILEHPAVGGFMTHCGWNSTLEGICSGVPMIAWPILADQYGTARYIHGVAKVGLMVSSFKEENKHNSDGITQREIELVIKKVFLEEEGRPLRSNVEELQKLAKAAVSVGGSSYNNLEKLINELKF